MTPDIAVYILGAALVPTIGWGVYVTAQLNNLKRVSDRLLHMHEHADEFGFGTVEMRMICQELSHAIRSMTHYIKWMCEQQTGIKPPPPLDGDD